MKFLISLAVVISVVFAAFWAWEWYEQKQLENYNTGGPAASRLKPQTIPKVKLADISQIPFSNMDWRLKRKGHQYRQEGDWVTYHAHQLSKCKQGSIGRCYDLAIHDIAWPDALPDKRDEFLKWKKLYRSACNVDHTAGCLNTALIHRYGETEDIDFQKSRDMLETLCTNRKSNGAAIACTEIGRQILSDLGNKPNDTIEHAIEYLSLACDEEEYRACTVLSYIYQHGQKLNPSIIVSQEKSLQLIEKSCDIGSGDEWACYQKSLRHAAGETKVDKDVIRGKLGISMACKQGIQQACKGFDNFNNDKKWKFDQSIN